MKPKQVSGPVQCLHSTFKSQNNRQNTLAGQPVQVYGHIVTQNAQKGSCPALGGKAEERPHVTKDKSDDGVAADQERATGLQQPLGFQRGKVKHLLHSGAQCCRGRLPAGRWLQLPAGP